MGAVARVSELKKALVSGAGAALAALAFTHHLPYLPTDAADILGVFATVLTPTLTWLVPNEPQPG